MSELSTATSLDDMQDVGWRCRGVLIEAGRLLADPTLVPDGGVTPQAANTKGWLDLFLTAHAAGRTHRELRAFVSVCWDLAQKSHTAMWNALTSMRLPKLPCWWYGCSNSFRGKRAETGTCSIALRLWTAR